MWLTVSSEMMLVASVAHGVVPGSYGARWASTGAAAIGFPVASSHVRNAKWCWISS